jgi:hypothetical protein
MSRLVRALALVAVVAAFTPLGSAQYPSQMVLFDDSPIGDPATCQEMFRMPEFSGSTAKYIVANTTGQYNNNAAFRAAGLQYAGPAALEVLFKWDDVNDANSWVRLSTYNTTSTTPAYPNPALHTAGKVRFAISNRSEFFAGKVGICLLIRETGTEVMQMANGGTTGSIELAGVSQTPNGIMPDRTTYTVHTTAVGDDEQLYPVGTYLDPNDPNTSYAIGVGPGPNGVMDTTPAGGDEYRRGFFKDGTGIVPVPVAFVDPLVGTYTVEFNLATGAVTLVDVIGGTTENLTSGTAPFTGNGLLDGTPQRGVLEAICITKAPGDTATSIDLAIDNLQFEAPVPDPVPAPAIKEPVIKNDTTVTVTGIFATADQVELYVDGGLYQTLAAVLPETPFGVPAVVAGQKFKARQHDPVTSQWSAFSPEVTALPARAPYTISMVIDENANNCEYGTGGGWEYLPCTGLNGTAPIGMNLFPNSAIWQTIDIPYSSPVRAWLGGNSVLNASPNGNYSIDSMWLSQTAGNAVGGPHELLIDTIEVLDPNGVVLKTVENMENGVNYYSTARGQSVDTFTASGLVSTGSYDGGSAHRLQWTFGGLGTERVLAMYHSVGGSCGVTPTFPDNTTGATLRYHLVVREIATSTVALASVAGPIIKGDQTSVRVTNIDATATAVELFVNGVSTGAPVNPAGATTLDFAGLTFVAGDSIAVKQTVGGVASEYSYPRAVSAAPLPPTVVSPILPTVTQITVNGLITAPFTQVNLVTVYVNGVSRGTAVPAAGATSVVVTITPAVAPFDVVTATQTVNTVMSAPSAPVTVSVPAPTVTWVPAVGDTTIRVQDLNASANYLVVNVDGVDQAQVPLTAGFTQPVTVPVAGLTTAGQQVKVKQSVNGAESGYSAIEVVTVNTLTTIFADTMEAYADQADFDNPIDYTVCTAKVYSVHNDGWWAASNDPDLTLATDNNTTPGGSKSAYAAAGMSPVASACDTESRTAAIPGNANGYQANFDFSYPDPDWANAVATDTEPLIWNVNIYDATGPGVNNVFQWSELRSYTPSLAGIVAVGMVGTYFYTSADSNYYQLRAYVSPGYLNLNHSGAPQRSIGWHNFTAVLKGTTTDFYVDGKLARKGVNRTSTVQYNNMYMGSGYAASAPAWYDDFYLQKGKVRFGAVPPGAPTIGSPVVAGDTTLLVRGVSSAANGLDVYVGGTTLVGHLALTPPNALTEYTVSLTTPLVYQQLVTVKQTNDIGSSPASLAVEVGKKEGPLTIAIGIRETADTGAIGTPGSGSVGSIKWVGVAAKDAGGAPIGKPISPANAWQTFTFDPAVDPNFPFSGTGPLASANGRGVLEHLAVAVDSAAADRSSGPYRLYVDNVVNVGAGTGGADVVLSNFDSFALGSASLFQAPGYSGSTSGNLVLPLNISRTSNVYGNTGQAQELEWFFRNTNAGMWARITTASATNVPQPIIDLTKPIRMDVLLLSECANKGDLDGSGAINFADFQQFKNCLAGPGVVTAPGCNCADFNDDGRVDLFDFAEFQVVYQP